MKIKNKLMLALSFATVIPVLVVTSIIAYLASSKAVEDFENTSGQTLSVVQSNFENFIGNIEKTVDFLATSQVLTAEDGQPFSVYHSPEGQAPAEVAMEKGGYERSVFQLFKDLGQNHPEFVYVYAGDQGDGYVEWPGTYEYAEWEPKKEHWYSHGMNSVDEVALPGAYYWEPDDAVYITAVRGFKRQQSVVGAVAIDVSIKTLTDMVRNTPVGETGSLMVIEDTGTILVDIISPDNNFKNIDELSSDQYKSIAQARSGMLEVNIADKPYIANVMTSPELGWKFVALVPEKEIFVGTMELIQTTIVVCIVLLLIFALISYFMATRLIAPIERVSSSLKNIAEGEGDLTAKIDIQSKDETGVLSDWFNQFLESTRALIADIKSSNAEITEVAEQTSSKAHQVANATTEQQQSIDQIVSAGQQMVVASNDAAQNCSESAQFSEQALEATQAGKKLINESTDGVNRLGERLQQSNKVIAELENETGNINQILSTIQDIAEQTNLLALNAAIEAARAGEQGRGFAVVADEVRGLAQRTQESTEQINTIIGVLLNRTKEASQSMVESLGESEKATKLSEEALNSFHNIEEMVQQMHDMTLRTAASAEEQRAVTEDINGNISAISLSAQQVSHISDEVAELCQRQDQLSKHVQGIVSRFRT